MDGSAIPIIGVIFFVLMIGLMWRQSPRNNASPDHHVSPAELHEYGMRLLEELVTLPVERSGYIKVFPATRRLKLNHPQALQISAYLRQQALVEGRTWNAGVWDELRLTAAGHRALEQRRRPGNTDPDRPSGYLIINNFGSMVHARDIHGGAVNAGAIDGDQVVGVTADQMIALARALRSDASNTMDPALQQQAKECAAELEASAGDSTPTGAKRRQTALDQATKLVGLAQGVFTLTQGVVQAIFGT